MSLALALLALVPQDVPSAANAADAVDGEEIVVRAHYGRTTMLFDKGPDGTLRNCRIMVSSGSQKRDTDACKATPVCYAGTADEVTDCVELSSVEPATVPLALPMGTAAPPAFTMPQLVKPKPAPSPLTAGPNGDTDESAETERQRVKLPPVPRAPSDGPAIKVTLGDGRQEP